MLTNVYFYRQVALFVIANGFTKGLYAKSNEGDNKVRRNKHN